MKPKLRFKGYDEKWKNHSLSEACSDFKYGLNAAATEFNGKEKYLRITDIDDSSRIFSKENLTSPDVKNLTNEYQLSENDIVFARTGASVGKTYLYDSKDGEVYWAGFLIRGKVNEKFDSNFVFQNTLTKNYNKFILITSQRSGQPGVNANEYGEFSFRAPSKVEQRKIGEYFRKLDGLIRDTGKEIEKLENLKQASLQKMFPQPGESVPQLRFKGFSEPWQEKRLGEISFINKGEQVNKNQLLESGPYYVLNGGIEPSGYFDKFNTKGHTISISEGGNSCGYVFFNEKAFWSGGHNYTVIPNIPDIDNIFLYYFLKGKELDIMSKRVGSGLPNIQRNSLLEYQIYFPSSYEEQKAIGDYFWNLDNIISAKKKKLEKLRQVKSSCLNLMFV